MTLWRGGKLADHKAGMCWVRLSGPAPTQNNLLKTSWVGERPLQVIANYSFTGLYQGRTRIKILGGLGRGSTIFSALNSIDGQRCVVVFNVFKRSKRSKMCSRTPGEYGPLYILQRGATKRAYLNLNV